MATDGYSKYVVSAGHCDGSNRYYQGSTDLGVMAHRNEKDNSDVAAIGQNLSLNYSGGKIYRTATTTDKYDRTQNASEDVVGEPVCMSGASSDTNAVKCGTLESRDFSGSFDGIWFTKLRKASYESIGGDSGGTVYGGTTLKGVNKGYSGSSGVYSHLEYCIRDLSAVSGRTN